MGGHQQERSGVGSNDGGDRFSAGCGEEDGEHNMLISVRTTPCHAVLSPPTLSAERSSSNSPPRLQRQKQPGHDAPEGVTTSLTHAKMSGVGTDCSEMWQPVPSPIQRWRNNKSDALPLIRRHSLETMSPHLPAQLSHLQKLRNEAALSCNDPCKRLSTRRRTLPAQVKPIDFGGGGLHWFGPAARNARSNQIRQTEATATHKRQELGWFESAGSWVLGLTDSLGVPQHVRRRVWSSIDAIGKVATLIIAEYPCGETGDMMSEQSDQPPEMNCPMKTPPTVAEGSDRPHRRATAQGTDTAFLPTAASAASLLRSPASPSSTASGELGHKNPSRCVTIFKETCSVLLLTRATRIAHDAGQPSSDRFCAVVRLECALTANPYKRDIVAVLRGFNQTESARQRRSAFDTLYAEIAGVGGRCMKWLVPAAMHEHVPFFSFVYSLLVLVPFFYMSGAYTAYEAGSATAEKSHVLTRPTMLLVWLRVNRNHKRFSSEYLRLWGARFAPDIANGEYHRWFSSVLIHQSFAHMLWNWVLLICISWHLEQKYAAWRVGLLWGISCIGGQLISAVWEDPCRMIVGASGGVFGIMGLFLADMIVNFRTIKRPILRSLLALLMLVLCVQEVKAPSVSGGSHVGGFICGLLAATLLLPKVGTKTCRWRRWELSFGAIAVTVLLFVYVGLPVYLYTVKLTKVSCG